MDVVVKQSPNDKREYKRLVLDNGIQTLLIHDADVSVQPPEEEVQDDKDSGSESEEEDQDASKKAAACLVVGVGSFSDPEGLPGLAHYLEHMLFMGSEKFPDENEYDSYLSKNGGMCNAYTDGVSTTFYFDVDGCGLIGALDRFAQFFISPLCLESAMEREVMAVDSEFSLYIQDDDWRKAGLFEETAKKESPFYGFTIGNRQTLKDVPESKGISVKEKMLEFYKQHYSADRMYLTVLGGQSLQELESIVGDMFSNVPRSVTVPPSIKGSNPYEVRFHRLGRIPMTMQGSTLYMMPSIERVHRVSVTFQLPSLISEYKKKADGYISHLIGHEGTGSLLSELKLRGWAYELSAGVPDSSDFHSNALVSLFEVTITITDDGLGAPPGYGLAPVMLLFSFIKMLRSYGPFKWIYDELKHVAEISVRFLEQTDSGQYVREYSCPSGPGLNLSRISDAMSKTEAGDELLHDHMFEEWDRERVSELLSLMDPYADGLRIDLQTSNYEELKNEMPKHKLQSAMFKSIEECHQPWYAFPYIKCPLRTELLDLFANYRRPLSFAFPPMYAFIDYACNVE